MTTTGNVEITVVDNGGAIVQVPLASLQAVLGCSTTGTPNQITSTKSLPTLLSTFSAGPLLQAAGLSVNAGGVVLAMNINASDPGAINGQANAAINIVSSTNATPIEVTTATHNLITGSVVTIAGHLTNTAANGTWIIVVDSSTTFHLVGSVGVGVGGATGTVQFDGVIQTSSNSVQGTSTCTVTGVPNDTYFVQASVVSGGTLGTGPIALQLSLDAARNFGPIIQLGAALTYTLPGTGTPGNDLVLTFITAKTLATGDVIRFSTIAPSWNTSDLQAGLLALASSPYANNGWGSLHIVGGRTALGGVAMDGVAGAAATTIETGANGLDVMARAILFTRAEIAARDVAIPQAWGGPGGESEAQWMASIITDYSATQAIRELCGAGNYNMPSAFPTAAYGTPAFRRPLTWAQAARQVQIAPQTHSGRVADGALAAIVVDPISDPRDGFTYHNEAQNPGLDSQQGGAGRFCSARTRRARPGIYIVNPLLLAPPGSQFWMLPFGNVMDVGCALVDQVATTEINSDTRVNANGTIYENDAAAVEQLILAAISVNMGATGMLSSTPGNPPATVVVDRAWNVRATSKAKISGTFQGKAYLLEIDVSLGFAP